MGQQQQQQRLAGSACVWVVAAVILAAVLAGGGCLVLYLALPGAEAPHWLSITDLALVAFPWAFWPAPTAAPPPPLPLATAGERGARGAAAVVDEAGDHGAAAEHQHESQERGRFLESHIQAFS
uniref:Uncharacterized protein n=1 Tax=Leersia perrieri TaxID=77586 RepID=A0A0D9XUK7_9ORYZ